MKLPADLGEFTVEGTIRGTSFEFEGDAELRVGGFYATGRVKVTNSKLSFSGYFHVDGGGTVWVKGEIEGNGNFLFEGSGSVGVRGGLSVSGSFEFRKSGSTVTFKCKGGFNLANIATAEAEFFISSKGSFSGSSTIKFAGNTFSVAFSLSEAGVASVEGSLSFSGSIDGVSGSGTGSLYLDSTGNVKGKFKGKAKGPLGNTVDVNSDLSGSLSITINVFGSKYTIQLG